MVSAETITLAAIEAALLGPNAKVISLRRNG
jgi:hypothetical protein